jgi:HAMP domain-containing protein
MSPATTGTGAELQQMRSAMQNVENKNWQAQFPHLAPQQEAASLAGNIETAMTGLLAQAGRRAGKRRNR